jgi:hypothetical protein
MDSKLLNTGEAARKLKRHPGTLVNWRVWKTGPKYQTDKEGQVWYKEEDIDAYADQQKKKA